jgi:excisionase family DNA binding protein
MTDRVLIPFGSELLVFTESELVEARRRGRELVPHASAAPAPATQAAGLVTAKALATEFSLPVSCIYEYAKAGRIPCVRVGKHVRFDKQLVRSALQSVGGST